MRVHSAVCAHASDGDKISNVAVAERAGRQMRHDVVDVTYNVKTLPTLGNGDRNASVDHARASKSKAEETVAQIGAVVVDKLMAEHRECRAVTVSDDHNAREGVVGQKRRHVWL